MVYLLRSPRSAFAFFHDIAMAAASFVLSLMLRLGDLNHIPIERLALGTAIFTATAAIVFLTMRMYRGIWRYASVNDLINITKAASLVILIFFVVLFVLVRLDWIPRSLPFINWFVLLALLGGPRFLYRLLKDRTFEWKLEQDNANRIPVLLIGAGDGAELFIRAEKKRDDMSYRTVGILSESGGRVGRHIHGVNVLGTFDQLGPVLQALHGEVDRPQRLVLTRDDIDGAKIQALLKQAEILGLSLSRMANPGDLKSGSADKLDIRPIAIEDLLGRPQASLDRDAMAALISNKRVLITGAGGSIGSELVRQVSDFVPANITLVENSEFALYTIDMELSKRHETLAREAVICDVRDRDAINALFERVKPELVFHAAALKHVPLVEANPCEGVRTNVTGSVNVADACMSQGVGAMVMISTDKAINPTNVMGATKRIAEKYVQALDLERGADDGTRFVTVRFGNVLGSTGSVVPLFERQLKAGGPLTVTHPDMTRFFMTIREAVELILQASATGHKAHDQDGKIFVLDMGDPVKIVDLAKQMIRLAGFKPEVDIQITFTGPRPGEKLFEEVLHDGENTVPTENPGILLAAPRASDAKEMRDQTQSIDEAARGGDIDGVIARIHALVPEYEPAKH